MGFLARAALCVGIVPMLFALPRRSPATLGNPWPVTLSQVAFGTFILMLCVLYAFLAKGWLR